MNMIASVLHLDRRAVKALRITDPYSLHRVVFSLYEETRSKEQQNRDESSGIQFADLGGDSLGRRILMLSNRQPADCIDGQYGQVLSKPVPENFLEHDHYQFQVTINPTRRGNASRSLEPVKGRQAIADWFIQRAEKSWGFNVHPKHLVAGRIEVLRFKDKSERLVTIGQAQLQGKLTVTDREQFRTSFTLGIGRARSFGCGLLQLVPLLDNPFPN